MPNTMSCIKKTVNKFLRNYRHEYIALADVENTAMEKIQHFKYSPRKNFRQISLSINC